MQDCTATVIGFVYSRLLRLRSVREGRDRNLGGEAKSCTEEFLLASQDSCNRETPGYR